MKKILLFSIGVCTSIILLKYFFSNYELNYNIDGYNIMSLYKDNRLYFEIDNKYNFDIYMNSNFKKILIKDIIKIDLDDYECIYPVIDNIKLYPLCYKDGMMIDYNLIEDDRLNEYKNNNNYSKNNNSRFYYFGNLDNTYVALWNYNGYYIMNGNEYENISLFEDDRYDNSLSFMYNGKIYMPDYSQSHTFNSIVILNMKSKEQEYVSFDYNIDYDSYLVGEYSNKMYIFDNKYSILYEFDLRKNKMSIKGSNKLGFTKYFNGEEVVCSKSEYKVDKITYNDRDSLYSYYFEDNGLYKVINDNSKIYNYILNKNVSIVAEYKNYLYYVYNNSLFRYSPYDNEEIFYFNELEFNKDNSIFIYSY